MRTPRHIGVFVRLGIFFVIVSFAYTAQAASVKGRTFPMPPKTKAYPADRYRPAFEVPHPIENYKFKVTGEVDGTVYHPAEVPLWRIEDYTARDGAIAVGSEVKAEYIRLVGGRHYYGFEKEPASVKPAGVRSKKISWIDGRFLRLDQ